MRYFILAHRLTRSGVHPRSARTAPATWRHATWRRGARLALAASALLAAHDLDAQTGYTTPRVRIAPPSGSYVFGAQVTASVQYCSQYPFLSNSETLTFNGQPVPLAGTSVVVGTQADCPLGHHDFERRNIVLTLGYGANLFRATIENDLDGNPDTDDGYYGRSSATYSTPWPRNGVVLVADNRYAGSRPSVQRTERYAITNSGDVSTKFTVSCTWSPLTGCSLSRDTLTLGAGASETVTATVPVGAVGSVGTLGITVSGGVGPLPASASAVTEISALAPPPTARGVTLVNPAGTVERDLCVTIKAGNDAAMECGDLRLAHALPSIRTKGKLRTPVLLFNGALAEPMVRIPADVALDAGFVTTPPFADRISATVVITSPASMAGQSFLAGEWTATDWPENGEAQRIIAAFDGSTLPSGKYGYQLVIRRTSDEIEDVATGTLLHVNRSRSPLHAGWWLAGLEQLLPVEGNQLLWVGGDGSTRLYSQTASCDWRAENVDRVDRVICGANGWYTRLLPNGLRVVFDPAGRHRYTVNRHADTTEFTYNAQGALGSIVVPPRANGVGAASYVLHYGASSALLDSVTAPSPDPLKARRLRVTWVHGRPVLDGASGSRILTIKDADKAGIELHYANETSGQGDYRPTSRVDRRGTTTTFAYSPGGKLASASTPASATETVLQQFRPAEGQGVAAGTAESGRSIPLDSVYTRLDGPRTDVVDETKWWVNRFGAPLRVRDPMGAETVVEYDATWPGLAMRKRGPTGLETRAVYSSMRGLVESVTAYGPYGSSKQNAVTRYFWHATWDMPDSVKAPTGEVTRRAYDADGNVLWEQAGGSAARRVTFAYDPTTRQLTSVRYPGVAGHDSVEYDAVLRNVARTISPAGRWMRRVTDGLGRDTLVESSIDGTRSARQRITYDVLDRVIQSQSIGPAMPYTLPYAESNRDTATVLADTLIEFTTYDLEGNVTRIQKRALPNPRPWLPCPGYGVNTQCSGITDADTGSIDVRTYDGMHRLKTQRLGSSGGRFKHDPAGNVIERLSWANGLTKWRYDAANRPAMAVVTERPHSAEFCESMPPGPLHAAPYCFRRFPIYPNDGAGGLTIPADSARFVYDQAGLLRGAHNAFARVDRTYYPAGALATDTLRLRDYAGTNFGLKYGLGYVYDVSGRRIRLRTPWAADSIRYAYDRELGVLDTVWQGNARIRFTYDLAGRQDSLLIGTPTSVGVREGRKYDPDGMLVQRDRVSALLGGLVKDTLLYDLRDKAVDVTTWSRAIDVGTLEYHTRYSGLGAVLAQQKVKTPSTWEMEEFRATALGDVYRSRKFRSDGDNEGAFPLLSQHNALGALIAKEPVRDMAMPGASTFEDTTYAHVDGSGNVIRTGTKFRSLINNGPLSQMATRSYFGDDNKLRFQQRYVNTGMVGSGSGGIESGSWEEHWYDALGRKVLTRARRDSLCSTTTTEPCTSYIERTVWDDDQVLYELRTQGGDSVPAGTLNGDVSTASVQLGKVGYVHAGGIDAPLVLMDGRVPNYNWRGLAESSVWLDGSAADCTVSGGSPCTQIYWPGNQGVYMKPPLGQTSLTDVGTWAGSLLANGVGSTGMAYRRNRFYDGTTGQFNQQDPIGLAGGPNSYGFAGGDPVNYSDPFGLCPNGPKKCGALATFWMGVNVGANQLRGNPGPGIDEDSRAYRYGLAVGNLLYDFAHPYHQIDGAVAQAAGMNNIPIGKGSVEIRKNYYQVHLEKGGSGEWQIHTQVIRGPDKGTKYTSPAEMPRAVRENAEIQQRLQRAQQQLDRLRGDSR